MCAGVLGAQRRAIMGHDLDFDGLLRLCIGLAGNLDLPATLRCAEKLARAAGPAGAAALAAVGAAPCCAAF